MGIPYRDESKLETSTICFLQGWYKEELEDKAEVYMELLKNPKDKEKKVTFQLCNKAVM